jgi:hypothetical protein
VSALLDVTPQTRTDANSLRYLHDTIDMHMSAQSTLTYENQRGEVTAAEVLIAMLKRKIPSYTLKRWETKIIENEKEHSIIGLLAFLEKKAELEEAMQTQRKTVGPKSEERRYGDAENKNESRRTASTLRVSQEKSMNQNQKAIGRCAFCHENKHMDVGDCAKLKNLSVKQLADLVHEHRLCYNCLKRGHTKFECTLIGCSVDGCTRRHHRLLHTYNDSLVQLTHAEQSDAEGTSDEEEQTSETDSQKTTANGNVGLTSLAISKFDPKSKILQVVRCLMIVGSREFEITAVLDGGSQTSLVEKALAEALGLTGSNERVFMNTPGHVTEDKGVQRYVTFALAPIDKQKDQIPISALTLKNVCDPIGMVPIPENYKHLQGLDFAPGQGVGGVRADVLVGVDFYWAFFSGAVIKGGRGEPTAMQSIFGWVVSGPVVPVKGSGTCGSAAVAVKNVHLESAQECNCKNLKQFWEGESLPDIVTDEQQAQETDSVLQFHKDTTIYKDGRYHVRFPWAAENKQLPNNYPVAYRRFKQIESRLVAEPAKAKAYKDAINEYESLDFAEEVTETTGAGENVWYLPHHGVFKADRETTKTRVVFDGSARFQGMSINTSILTGPALQPDIVGVILRFRMQEIALISDIKKMFLQIGVQECDRNTIRYLWRNGPSEPLRVLRFKRVCFGLNVSPFLAIATIKHHAGLMKSEYPRECAEVNNNMYVDDFITGSKDVAEAREFVQRSIQMMNLGGFELVKWVSNRPEALDGIPQGLKGATMSQDDSERSMKVLGVFWNITKDTLSVSVGPSLATPLENITKRQMLKKVASIFDPQGVIAPYTIRGKILLQETCKANRSWDEEVPNAIATEWRKWEQELGHTCDVAIERCLLNDEPGTPAPSDTKWVLHVFGDASAKAYGSVAYMSITTTAEKPKSKFLIAKSRVAPLKPVTIPCMELLAALLTAQLAMFIHSQLGNVCTFAVKCYTDSEIVLAWIRSGADQTKTFVKNRIIKILRVTDRGDWHHCPGNLNPADMISRGTTIRNLIQNRLWLNGPDLVHNTSLGCAALETYNGRKKSEETEDADNGPGVSNTTANPVVCNRLSVDPDRTPLKILLPVTAWIKRFKYNSLAQSRGLQKQAGDLTVQELKQAERVWIKQVQREHFPEVFAAHEAGQLVPKNSPLIKLDPKVDDQGCLRVGGRLDKAMLPFRTIHPLILPRKAGITRRVVENRHRTCLHAGKEHVPASLRSEYWIPSGRSLVKEIVRKCPVCIKSKSRRSDQKMGSLPAERVREARPFENVGLDFAGPIHLRESGSVVKAYICLFVCTAVRAVHLELSSSMLESVGSVAS